MAKDNSPFEMRKVATVCSVLLDIRAPAVDRNATERLTRETARLNPAETDAAVVLDLYRRMLLIRGGVRILSGAWVHGQ